MFPSPLSVKNLANKIFGQSNIETVKESQLSSTDDQVKDFSPVIPKFKIGEKLYYYEHGKIYYNRVININVKYDENDNKIIYRLKKDDEKECIDYVVLSENEMAYTKEELVEKLINNEKKESEKVISNYKKLLE